LATTWQVLAGNLAAVALFVLSWAQLRFWLSASPRYLRRLLFGLVMGVGAVASMMLAVELQPGLLFDLRASLLIVAGFFGGPLATGVSIAIALAYRIALAGTGLWSGVALILAAGLISLTGRLMLGRRKAQLRHALLLGCAAGAVAVSAMFALPADAFRHAFTSMAVPVSVLNFAATGLAGIVFIMAGKLSSERDLLAAALAQAPDSFYVKDREGRFAAVNVGTVRINGFQTAQQMVGLTDFSLTDPARARVLFEREQQILATGTPMLDEEELLPDASGNQRWFSISKVPLRTASGTIIGLAGLMRDVTEAKRLREKLLESGNMLSYALAEMSDGLAMFGVDGRIVFCNEQYRAAFPLSGPVRVPGAHLRTILTAVIESGEQLSAPSSNTEAWISQIIANLHRESEEEINLFDGRWLRVRTRPASAGATLVVVSDFTRIKQAELELHSTTSALRELVRTDGLTGLLNRRAFDEALEAEIRRSLRGGTPLSLLLIDVDRFKAFNDRYGHPAGDSCLRLVSQLLRSSLKRPADLAARYGGEEFAAILPETDEDGAYLVAEAFRQSLSGARVEHGGSEKGVVTASVGVATYTADSLDRSGAVLLQTADEALYGAKGAGRDRVFGRRLGGTDRRYARS